MRSRRLTLLVVAGVAIVSLAAGWLAGQFIRSPEDEASRVPPPEAARITVPVELRALTSEVRTRGDAAYAGSVDVALDLGGLETPPVVTGHVPGRGDEVVEGEPLLEVVGRPVIALRGELPMYRSLSPGMSGPDVEQLKETLRRLSLAAGADNDFYDAVTAQGVAELYRHAGYQPPPPEPAVAAEVGAAEDAVAGAEQALAASQATLDTLWIADPAPPAADLAAAETQVEHATAALLQAREELGTAQFRAGTRLPAAEVHYLPSLPRYVDSVAVSRGDYAEGVVMSLSGARLRITTLELDPDSQRLLAEGMPAVLDLPSGEAVGTVTEIGSRAVIRPPELEPAEVDALLEVGNILVTIPVESTDGLVLAVPEAAVDTGPGGETRVEVERDDGARTELVEVELGLNAQGYYQVTPVDQSLTTGDLVVVGQAGIVDESTPEASEGGG
jgi:peptidoglycan hydrolase-like protein with peptidoglycan-binding domain